MAANTRVGYTIGITADTKAAKAQMQELMDSISKISKQASLSYDTKSIKEGIAAAKELERHLQNAFNVSTGNLDLSKLNTSLRATGTTLDQLASRMQQFGVSGQAAFSQLASTITSAQVPLKHTTAMVDNLMINLKKTAQWQFSSTIIHGLVGQIQSAIGYVRNLNGALTDIAIVSDLSSNQLAKFAADAQRLGKSLSASTLDVSRAALIYFQQGDNALKSMEKAAITIKAANASANSSAAEMSEYLTAIWNSYQVGSKELEKYVDMMAALGAKTASSMEEIATAMQKVAATANTVGVGFDQMSSIISTVSSVTRESAETIGTSYKTILARIGDLKLGKIVEDGVEVSLGQVSSALKQIGVNVMDVRGNMRDMGLVIEEIGTKWQSMSDAQKTATAQVIAGKRQYTQLMALFENWDMYQNNVLIANDSNGALNKMQETWATGWEAASNRVRVSLEGIYSSLIDDSFVVGLLNVFSEMLSGIDSVIDRMGGLGAVAVAVGSTIVGKLGNRTHEIFDALKSNLGLMTGQTQKDMILLNQQLAQSQAMVKAAKTTSSEAASQPTARALRGEAIATKSAMRAEYLKNQNYLSEEARMRYEQAETRYTQTMQAREAKAEENRRNAQSWATQKRSRADQVLDSAIVTRQAESNTQMDSFVEMRKAEMRQAEAEARRVQMQRDQAARDLEELQASQRETEQDVAKKQTSYDQKYTSYTHTAPEHAEDKARHKRDSDAANAELQASLQKKAEIDAAIAKKQQELTALEVDSETAEELKGLAQQEYGSAVELQKGAQQDAAATLIPKELLQYRDQLKNELGATNPLVVDLSEFIELKAGNASQEEVAAAAQKLNATIEEEFFKASKKRSKIAADDDAVDFNEFYGLGNIQNNIQELKSQAIDPARLQEIIAQQKQAIKDSLAAGADGDESIIKLGLEIDSAASLEELEAKLTQIREALDAEKAKAEMTMETAKGLKEQFGASEEDIQVMETEANRRNVEAAEDRRLREESDAAAEDMQNALKPAVELSDALGAVAGGLGSIISLGASLKGTMQTIFDPEATGVEKFTAALISIVSILNTLSTLSSATKTLSLFADKKNTVNTVANTVATVANAKAKKDAARASALRGAALDKESKDLVENTIANGGNTLGKGLKGTAKNFVKPLGNAFAKVFGKIGTVIKGLASKLLTKIGSGILKGLVAKIAGAGAAVVGGVATAIVVAVIAAVKLWNKHLANIDKELAERQEALNSALNTQTQQQQNLQNDLVALSAVMQNTSLSYDEQLTKINEICAAYGVQATMLDVLSGNYTRLGAVMRNAAVAKNNANSYLADQNLSAAEQIVADRRAQLTGIFQHKNRVLFDETNDVVKAGNARASLLNDAAWTSHGWDNDGNVRGIMNEGYLAGETGKQYFSAEGQAWLQIADKLEEAGFRFNQATASLEEITPGQGNGALLAQMIQDDASLSQYINSEGSYTAAIFDELQTVGYVDLARAQRQQQQSTVMGELLRNRNFDFLGSSDSTYTLKDVQNLISQSLGKGEYNTGVNQEFLASYLASFSQYADAANQYLAVSELANTVLSINPTIDIDPAVVTEGLLNILDDEFTIDALLKINPTDIIITPEGQVDINDAVKQYAIDLAKKDSITKRRDTIAANKDLLTKDVYTYDDYALLKETDLFKDDADINRFMNQSASTRLREITLMEEKAVNDLIANAEDIIKSGAEAQKVTNAQLGEFYKGLEASTQAQWEKLSQEVVKDIEGKSGVGLFTSLNNWKGTYEQLATSATTVVDTWTSLGVSDKGTWGQTDTTQKQDIISQLASIGITSVDGRALTTASSYEDVAKAIELAKTKQYEFISQSDTLNALISEGVELQSNYATKQAEIAEAEGDLEKAQWWKEVGQEIEKATKAAEAYVGVLQKGYKDVTSEDLNNLLLYDENAFAEYAKGTESWQNYIYEKSLEWYDQQMAIYNKAGDMAAFQQAMNERDKLIAEHNDNLLQETKAAGEAMEEISQSIEENISEANSFLSSLTKEGSFSAMSFESISKFKANLLELGYTAKEVDAILKNLGKDQDMTDAETALAATQMQLDLLLTGAAQQQQQYDAYINFHTEIVGGQVSDVLDFSNNALGLRTKDSSADVSIEMGDTPDVLEGGKDGLRAKVGESKNVGVGLDVSSIGTTIAGTGTITTDGNGKIIAEVGEKSTEFTFGIDAEGMKISDPNAYSLKKSTSGGYQLLVTGASGKTWVFNVNAAALDKWAEWGGGTVEKTDSGYGLKFTDQTGKEWTIGISDTTAEGFMDQINGNGIEYNKDSGFHIKVPDGEQTYTFKLGISMFPEMRDSDLFTEEGLLQFINQNGKNVTIDPSTHEFTAQYNVNGELNYGFRTAGSEEEWSWLNAAELTDDENTFLTAWLRGVQWSMEIELTTTVDSNSVLQQVLNSSKSPIPVTVEITYDELNEPKYWQVPGVGDNQITDPNTGGSVENATNATNTNIDPYALADEYLNAGVWFGGYDTYNDKFMGKNSGKSMGEASLEEIIQFMDSVSKWVNPDQFGANERSGQSGAHVRAMIETAEQVYANKNNEYDDVTRDNATTVVLNHASAWGRGFLRDEIKNYNMATEDAPDVEGWYYSAVEKALDISQLYGDHAINKKITITLDDEEYELTDLDNEIDWESASNEDRQGYIQGVMDQTYEANDKFIKQTYDNLGANLMAEFMSIDDDATTWSSDELKKAEHFLRNYWDTLMADIQENGLTESNITGMWLALGLVEGFTSSIDSSQIPDSLNDLIATMNTVLGVSSPSKRTMEMGYWLAEGLNVGLKNAKIKADGFGKKVLDAIKADIEKTLADSENDFATLLSKYQITAPEGESPFETYIETTTGADGNNSYTVAWLGDEPPTEEQQNSGWKKNADNTYSKTFDNEATFRDWQTSDKGQQWNQQAWNKRAASAKTGLANMGYTTTYNELEQGYEVVINGMTRILKTSEDWVQAYADAGEEYVTLQGMREYYTGNEFLNLDNNNDNTDITSVLMASVYEEAMKNWKNTHDGKELDFATASAEDILAFTGYMESAYEQMGVSLLAETELTWSQISDVIFGYIDSQVAAEAAAAQEVYKTWSETFQAIAEARKIILEGGNVGLEASEDTKQKLLSNWLSSQTGDVINLNDFHNQLYGKDATLSNYSFNYQELSSITQNGNAQYLNSTNGLLDPVQSITSYTENKRAQLAQDAETYVAKSTTHLEASLNAWDYMTAKTQEIIKKEDYTAEKYGSQEAADEAYTTAFNKQRQTDYLTYMRSLKNSDGEQIYTTEKYSDEQLMRYLGEADTYKNTIAWEAGHYDNATETWVNGQFDRAKLADEYVKANLGTTEQLKQEYDDAIIATWGDLDKYRMSLYKDAQAQKDATTSQKTEDLTLVQRALNGEDLTAVEQTQLDTILQTGESLSEAEDRLTSEIDAAADAFSLIEQAIQEGYLKDSNGEWVKMESQRLEGTYATEEEAAARAQELNAEGTHGTVSVVKVMTGEGQAQYVLESSIVTSNLGTDITEGEGGLHSAIPEEDKLTSAAATWDRYAARVGMTVEEFKTYANILNETLGEPFKDEKELANYAKKVALIEEGYKELAEVSSDTWKILKDDSKKGTREYAKTLSSMKKTMKKLFPDNEGLIDDDFVEQYKEQLEKMANGTEEEVAAAREAIQTGLLDKWAKLNNMDLDKTVTVKVEGQEDFTTSFNMIEGMLDQWDNEADKVITVDADVSSAEGKVMSALNAMLSAGVMTATQIEGALNAIGWDPEITWEPVTVTNENAQSLHGYAKVGDSYEPIEGEMTEYIGQTVYIPHINSVSNTGGPPPAPSPSGGGGGGGNKKPPKPKDPLKREDETERYRDINEELARTSEALEKIQKQKEKAFGKKYLDQLDAEADKLRENIDEQERYLEEIRDWVDKDQQALIDLGIGAEFDEEGNLSNYDEAMENLMDRMDGWTEEYNRRKLEIFNSNMSDEDKEKANEELDDWYEDREEEYEDGKEAIDQYSESLALLGEEEANLLEMQNQLSASLLEKITYKVEVVTEFNEKDLEILEYYKSLYEDNFEDQDDLIRNLTQSADEYRQNFAAVGQAYADLQAQYATGELTQADYIEGLQQLQDQSLDYAAAMEDLKKQIEEVYGNTLEMAQEEMDKWNDKLTHSQDLISSYISIMGLLGKGPNYKGLEKFYDAQLKTNLSNIATQKLWLDTWEEEAKVFEAKGTLSEEEQENYDKLQEKIREAKETLLSSTEAALQAVEESYTNTINSIFKELDEQLGGSADSLTQLAEAYGYYQEEQANYVSTSKELYEISKLNRDIDRSIEDALTTTSKEKLKALQEQINAMSELNELSEYDIEMMNLQYQLALAQIALEEAQASKDTVRLTRDSEGNMAYQYTADESKINEAQQQYEDILQQINDLSANRVSELEQQFLEIQQNYRDAAKEILLDTTLTEEEKEAKLAALAEHSKTQMLYIQEQYGNASEQLMTNQAAIASHYGQSLSATTQMSAEQMNATLGEMIHNTTAQLELFDAAIQGQGVEAFKQYLEEIGLVLDEAGIDASDPTGSMGTAAEEAANAAEGAANSAESTADRITSTLQAVNAATAAWQAQAAVLQQVQNAYVAIAEAVQGVVAAESGFTTAEGMATVFGKNSDVAKQQADLLDTQNILMQNVADTLDAQIQTEAVNTDHLNEIAKGYGDYLEAISETQTEAYKPIEGTFLAQNEYLAIQTSFANQLESLLAGVTVNDLYSSALAAINNTSGSGSGVAQNIELHADFPNAESAAEIREALEQFVQTVSQYANSSDRLN